MSTEELEKYNLLYSRFLKEMVDMHNAHLTFVTYKGRATLFTVRRHHKQIIKTQKELYKLSGRVYDESRENSKEKFAKQREERAFRKANPKNLEERKNRKSKLSITKNL